MLTSTFGLERRCWRSLQWYYLYTVSVPVSWQRMKYGEGAQMHYHTHTDIHARTHTDTHKDERSWLVAMHSG